MNKRIKELLAQAYDEAVPETWTTLSSEQLDRIYEKFAELIVRECVGVVENLSPGYNDYRNQIEDAFRGDCVGKIREHFGVEE